MASIYVTKVGDALDLICQREYGAQAGAVEQVLEANPHIKDVAHRLPVGAEITLPDMVVQAQSGQALKLWD
ncbi:tail protein X [Antarcticimicrobium sediminis]|uniref:Phage tail protein n=1 Tax=Antarcticimicrobium sediminis TaxID=2546227 RepID=A0A4R5EFK9_9RHOB|nr:tail protein X [Antarcticimicrobium sediminis]TDE33175.1 phage tail protein [Antarcticimicrobium sediminis]